MCYCFNSFAFVRLRKNLGSIYEYIESTHRLNSAYIRHLADALIHIFTTLIKFFMHSCYRILWACQSFYCRFLRNRVWIGCLMTLYTAHHLCDLFRRTCVTDSPACHGITLCQTTAGNGSIINILAKGSNADMLLLAIY